MSSEGNAPTLNELRASAGGELSRRPLVPITRACRDRHGIPSVTATGMSMSRAVDDLGDTREKLRVVGADLSEVDRRLNILKFTDAKTVNNMVKSEYARMYGSNNGDPNTANQCPYEMTGKNNSCNGCSLSNRVWSRLDDKYAEERGRE